MAIAVWRNDVKNAGRLFACLVLAFFTPESFGDQIRNYNIEDGLAQSQVHSILQDSRGYLWIGTYGGGVSRYDGLTFTNYGRKEGLSDGNVLSIIEDHVGNLWFATLRGACKYDGKTFTALSTKDGLASNSVYSILEDREGRLWFGTDRGLSRYDGLAFTNFYEKDGLAGKIVRSIIQDRNGDFWFGTDGGGVGKYDGKTFTTLSTKDGLASNSVYSILEDREGRLWFGTDRGLSRYDGLAFTNFYEKDGLAGNVVRSIIQDRNGDFWFGTNGGGVGKYDGKTFTNLTVKDGLSSNFVWSSIEDREGNLWFGTYRGGLNKYTLSPFTKVALNEGVSDQTVRTILEDREGRLWFGTSQGGVVRVDGKSIAHFRKKDGLADDFVLTAFEDLEGRLWFGTFRGVSRFDGKTFTNFSQRDGLSDDTIRAIIQDREGRLWFGTNTGGICRFDGVAFTRWTTANGLNSDEITAFVKDRQGAIWIGTRRGINIFDGDKFINFSEIAGLGMDDYIFAIREDSEGHMWFGAYGGRIIEYTPPPLVSGDRRKNEEWRGRCKILTSQNGFPDDRIVSLIFDLAGDLWIGTENGIDKLDLQKYKNEGQILFKHYGQDEIFPGIECIHNAVHQDRQGYLWFGTLRGAIRYIAEEDRPNEVEPLTHIVNLRLLSKDVDWSKYARSFSRQGLPMNLILPHHLNSLAFDFIGLSLAKSEKVRYQYRLEGMDKSWSPMGKERSATYRNLPPGEYVFKVIACNNDGLWNKRPATFLFEITPPYWKRWWFQILVILTATGGIQTYIKFRIRKLEKSNLELQKLTLVASKTDNAVLITDAAGTIEWVNESFTKTTGYSLEGLRIFKKDTLGAIFDKILLQSQSLLTEFKIDTKEGNPIWLSVSLTPIFNKKHELNKYVVLSLNITERRKAEEALRESEAKYRALFECANDAVFLLNTAGVHVMANQKATDMLGYRMEELIGLSTKDIVAPFEHQKEDKKLGSLLRGELFPTHEQIYKKKDGTEFPVETRVALIRDREGTPLFVQSIVRDITERKQAEEEIRKKNAELEAFIFMVSHDLKSPVVSIQGFCSSLMKNHKEDLNEKTLFCIQRMQANASLMTNLLEDLAELARIGRIEDKKTEISVQEVIKSVWAGASTSLATQNVEFIAPENLPKLFYSEKRLYQIFYNLLSNALKFRDEERTTKVEIGHQEDKDNYTFFVRDSGIGIEQKFHSKIFESFSQLKDIKSEGTGMGLAIVKKIVEANQGKVWVESQKGAGSTFYFTIPKNVTS
jgi:PAS domain S-box-containing protein